MRLSPLQTWAEILSALLGRWAIRQLGLGTSASRQELILANAEAFTALDHWRAQNAELPVSQLGTLDDRFAAAAAQPRFRTTLIALFAALALVLALVGTYGVLCHSVAQRTHEIGIRVAFGAEPDEVLKLVLKQDALPAIVGVLIGLCGSFALTGMLRNLLFGVSATDLPTFCGGSMLLTGTALVACYVPARRATRVDPVVALRYE